MYVPTNSGLRIARTEGIRYIRELCDWYAQRESRPIKVEEKEARGEEIPQIVGENRSDQKVIGITGEDILINFYSEWEMRQKKSFNCGYGTDLYEAEVGTGAFRLTKLGLEEKRAYTNSLFGLPTLCLIGKKEGEVRKEELPSDCSPYQLGEILKEKQREKRKRGEEGDIKIVVNPRYAGVAANMMQVAMNASERGDEITIEWEKKKRQVDVTAAIDQTIDFAIDIVDSGKTCRDNKLSIYAKLLKSDGIIIGNKKILELNWSLRDLRASWGAQRLEAIAKSDDPVTYEALKSLKEQIDRGGCSGGIH